MEKGNLKTDEEFSNWMRSYYNKRAAKISEKGYEYARWFSSPRKIRQYKFSTLSLLFNLRNIDFKNCLEIGCGPGTWTRLLIKKYPKSSFTCVDISKEMIRQFKKTINSKNVKTIVTNFPEGKFNKKYDFIFSSRAIEYIPNKPSVIKKMHSLLKDGGKGMIITSHPHPRIILLKKALGKKINVQHTQRISVKEMLSLLLKNHFRNIEFYPILFTDFKLAPTSLLFHRLYKKKWGILSRLFATGYVVKFQK